MSGADARKGAARPAATVAKLLKRHRVRRIDGETALRTLREPAVSVAPGTTEAAVAHVEVVFSQLAVIAQQLARAYGELDRLSATLSRSAASPEDEPGIDAQRDVEILSSLPGVGRIVLATLLAEAHDPLRRRDYQALRCLSGVAPVTKRSGKSLIVIRRLASHNRLQDAVYHWAGVAIQHDPVSKAKYAALRARGRPRSRASRRRRPSARRCLRDARKPDGLQSCRETSPCSVKHEPHPVCSPYAAPYSCVRDPSLRPPRHPGLDPGSREAGRGRCPWPPDRCPGQACPGSRSGAWTPDQVRGDNRGRKDGGCGRAAIRVPIRRKGRKPTSTNALHRVRPI